MLHIFVNQSNNKNYQSFDLDSPERKVYCNESNDPIITTKKKKDKKKRFGTRNYSNLKAIKHPQLILNSSYSYK